MRAAEVIGESKKGDWTTENAQFPIIEYNGEVASYGDYEASGRAGANVNWVPRQSYHYQTFTFWGEKELAKAGEARIDWSNRLNQASILTLNKYQNKTYFNGVAGLENYGLLNDPDLPVPQAAATAWDDGNAEEIAESIRQMVSVVIANSRGNVDRRDNFILFTSPKAETQLLKTNMYNVNVLDILKKNFPNLTIETAAELETDAGHLAYLFPRSVLGQEVMTCAFTEKMRAHPVIVEASSWKQKKSQGTWGTIVFLPAVVYSEIVMAS